MFSFFLIYAIGEMDWPRNMPLLFVGYFYMTWWCVSMGLVIAAFSERTVVFEKIWPPVSYMYLPVSGFFYMAAWMPAKIREILLTFMPALPCYEMIRGGSSAREVRVYYDIPQLTFILPASPCSASSGCATCAATSSTSDAPARPRAPPTSEIPCSEGNLPPQRRLRDEIIISMIACEVRLVAGKQ